MRITASSGVQDLEAYMNAEALACLSLGLPASVSHIVDEASPLHDLSVMMMAQRRMEVPYCPATFTAACSRLELQCDCTHPG